MINIDGGSGAAALFCSAVLWAFGMLVLYWVIRLAIRHALTDVGVRRLVELSYRDGQPPAEPVAAEDRD